MDFSEALVRLKIGHFLQRAGWNGTGLKIAIQRPDVHSANSLPYIYLLYPVGSTAYPKGARVPWLASQTDLMANDWRVVNA